MNVLGRYVNGNYRVTIFDDGTKVRENGLDHFRADFPESMDVKITGYCDMNCDFCHEDSSVKGKHGDIMQAEFIDKLHPYTELAIGGGNPLSHPDIVPFLEKCKRLRLIPSMTVNQRHFLSNLDLLRELRDKRLIYGLGVSLTEVTTELEEALSEFPNAVIHTIAGIVTEEQLRKLAGKGFKILFLGYKHFRRGDSYYAKFGKEVEGKISMLKDLLPKMKEEGWFEVMSFDNLAIEQLAARRLLTETEWEEFFMGEDGFATMYIDMVNKEFAKSSTSPLRYPMTDDIRSMFEKVRLPAK